MAAEGLIQVNAGRAQRWPWSHHVPARRFPTHRHRCAGDKLNATVVGNGAVVVDRLATAPTGARGMLAFFRDVPHGREWIASGGPAAIASITASESLQSPWDNALLRAGGQGR